MSPDSWSPESFISESRKLRKLPLDHEGCRRLPRHDALSAVQYSI